MNRAAGAMLTAGMMGLPQPARAQFSGTALYELGRATTHAGQAEGNGKLAYGMGASGSYSLFPDRALGFAAGGGVLVRGFGMDVPGRIHSGVGVFDQADLVADEWIAVRVRRIMAGPYLEQRRVNRGTSLGVIGSPVWGVGFFVEPWLRASGRTRARLSYARFRGGHLRLEGSDTEPELESGRSLRLSFRHQLSSRWGVRGEYANVRMELEPVAPAFGFFDHRQSMVTVGGFLSF